MKPNYLLSGLFVLFVFTASSAQSWLQLDTATYSKPYYYDFLGASIALSDDGSIAAVGANRSFNGTIAEQGKVVVMQRKGNVWEEKQTLLSNDGAVQDWFGSSVSMSSDGSIILVGASNKKIDTVRMRGKVYLYKKGTTAWDLIGGYEEAGGVYQSRFGTSISLSGDGNTAVIGTDRSNDGKGLAHIYTRNGTVFTQLTTLKDPNGKLSDQFGTSVAISKDGNTILVGASRKAIGSETSAGKVFVYVRNGSSWAEQAVLQASDFSYPSRFGYNVKISADGNTAVIGAPYKEVAIQNSQGRAYVFVRNGTTWTEQANFMHPDGAKNDYFGMDISLSNDGNLAVFGTPQKAVGSNTNQGKVYTFVRTGTTWAEQGTSFTGFDSKAGDYFGTTALSGDGKILSVGASYKYLTQGFDGEVYFYQKNFVTALEQNSLTASISCYPNPTSGYFQVRLERPVPHLDLKIYSPEGTLVQQKELMHVSQLEETLPGPKGIYLVQLKSANGEHTTFKIVKE